jgi:hypothetical protein
MGYKSRGNFQVSVCFKKCKNRDRVLKDSDFTYVYCSECVGNSNYVPMEKYFDAAKESGVI